MRRPLTTGFLFKDVNLLVDSGATGVTDDIRLVLVVDPGLSDSIAWSGILNLAGRMAFEAVAFRLPLVARRGEAAGKPCALVIVYEDDVPREAERYVSVTRPDVSTAVLTSNSAECLRDCLNTIARGSFAPSRTGLGVHDTFFAHIRGGRLEEGVVNGIGAAWVPDLDPGPCDAPIGGKTGAPAEDADLFRLHGLTGSAAPQFERDGTFPWTISSPSLSADTGIAVSTALAAWVMAATRIDLPMVFTAGEGAMPEMGFIIEETARNESPGPKDAPGSDDALMVTKRASFAGAPLIHVKGTAAAYADGFYPWLRLSLCEGGEPFAAAEALRRTVDRFSMLLGREQPDELGDFDHQRPSEPDPVAGEGIRHALDWDGEIDALFAAASEFEKGSGAVLCEVYASKPPEIRERLKARTAAILREKGYDPEVRVFDAFKPGLSRLLERALPQLKSTKTAAVTISCRPFEGGGDALELKPRWLHELFPGPEILARDLGIPRDRVVLDMDGSQKEVYTVTGLDRDRTLVFQDVFSPFYRQIPYCPAYPHAGSISPTCAGMRISKSGRVLLTRAVPTDRDRFWALFQDRVVPDLLAAMRSRVAAGSLKGETAFFDEIIIDVRIDESDRRLGFMDEGVRPMEALQEDLYFFLLNLGQRFCEERNLPEPIQIGRILPRVACSTETGRAGAVVRALPRPGQPASQRSARPVTPVAYDRLSIRGDRWSVHYPTAATQTHPDGNAAGQDLRDPAETARRQGFSCRRLTDGIALDLVPEAAGIEGAGQGGAASVDTGPLRIPDDRPLGAEEATRILFRLARHPNIHVWEIARSGMGRPVYAVEAYACRGDMVSIPRLRRARPTVLFNARHHANEVSSTTAVLRFIAHLTAEGGPILRMSNIVFIPLENVDGVAAFESLYLPGRSDMLHAARYNAVGAEFYGEYHKKRPRFPEAWAKKRLWQRWLPEIMADLHGVPGHEWCQPYAGYTPMGFEEFWLPRAFVWVHLPFLEDETHPLHAASLAVLDAMREAVAREPAIIAANAAVTARYEAYARRFDPETFPPTSAGDLTALPLLGRTRAFNYAVRHPAVTKTEVVVEVPDEVAHGSDLALCVRAHFIMQKALAGAVGKRRNRVVSRLDKKTGRQTRAFTGT